MKSMDEAPPPFVTMFLAWMIILTLSRAFGMGLVV
jgi:hypothetical protein